MVYSYRNVSYMKSFKSIPVKFGTSRTLQGRDKPTPITIKEPYKPDVKSFENTDEFTHYFRANEDAFKEPPKDEEDNPKFLSANKLNRTYKIPGYRIRIIRKGTDNEELTLVKDYYKRTHDNEEPLNEHDNNNYDECTNRIDELSNQLTDALERINNIEAFLLQLKR